ncbi:MAG: DNA repair protein RecN [Bacillota bacterium]
MLAYLSVKNVAILENIEVNFNEGMTALTGETGAGKSLLIDAIGLLLGDRASSDIVRTNAEYGRIKGIFIGLSDQVKDALRVIDIDPTDELTITRDISKTSQNRIKINHQTVTLQDLKSITQYLADIHTQHDTKRLINKDTYMELVDAFDDAIIKQKNVYQENRKRYLSALHAYNTMLEEKNTMLDKLDYYKFQLQELENHHLVKDEEADLDEQIELLENFDTIFQSFNTTKETLTDYNALENIYQASQTLDNIKHFNEAYTTLSERLKSTYYELDDIKDDIAKALSNLDFDPDELETLQTRKHNLDTLKRKYRKTINELVDYEEELKTKINEFENYDDALNEKKDTLINTFNTLKETATVLHDLRVNAARTIETKLLRILKDLELKNTQFKIVLEMASLTNPMIHTLFKEDGTDTIDFTLSTNKGEALKPLSHVASGGELSRIMLALKEILTEHMNLALLIFDEIDTGVSGFVASQVAEKMYTISKRSQVITITHLPQVAARADHHAYIYKETDQDTTKAYVKDLDHDGRIHALAEMISSHKVTASAIESAKELLK